MIYDFLRKNFKKNDLAGEKYIVKILEKMIECNNTKKLSDLYREVALEENKCFSNISRCVNKYVEKTGTNVTSKIFLTQIYNIMK